MEHTGFGILSEEVCREITTDFQGCRLCWAISPQGQHFISNLVLRKYPDFDLIPGLGAPLPGYVLLVSRQHRQCIAALNDCELDALCDVFSQVSSMLKKYSTEWCVFEHGSLPSNGPPTAGNTVDHLHLHFAPIELDLISDVASRLAVSPVSLTSIRDLHERSQQATNYIFVQNPDGKKYVIYPNSYPSQFVRQVIATSVSKGHLWDWKSRPQEDTSLETIMEFKSAGLIRPRVYFAHAIEGRSNEDVHREVSEVRDKVLTIKSTVDFVSMFELFEQESPHLGISSKRLVECERNHLRICDALLVDLSIPGHQYVGSIMEIIYASASDIPVVAIAGDSGISRRRWLVAHCSYIVKDLEEAISALKEILA